MSDGASELVLWRDPPACTCVACNESNERTRSTETTPAAAAYSGGSGTRATVMTPESGNSGCGKLILWGLLVSVGIVAGMAFAGITSDDVLRFFETPEPTLPPVVVVVAATPANTPTGTSTPTMTLTPTSTSTLTPTSIPTSAATHTPVPTATLRPTFTPSPTGTPTSTATGTATSTPTITPTVTPTAFVCGHVEMVLMGAGKKHKHCHTPTPEGYIVPLATPTYTPIPTGMVTQTATKAPIPTNTPKAVIFPTHTITPELTATFTPTVSPTPSPVSPPHLRQIDEKRYMLELINVERRKAGVPLVELGDNIAAQLHAEASFANCFSSHWGIDGLKPYMRYSLAGGYQSNAENGSGSDYCIKEGDGYAENRHPEKEIEQAMNGLMSSPGHRRNILDKWHKKVNIGLVWDRYNFLAYQHFEGDYVEYDNLPSIENGRLFFSGDTKNGVELSGERDLGVQLYYDSPPHELTGGQVSRTYCYDNGLPVAALRLPLKSGWRYNTKAFSRTYKPCPSPYDVPPDAPQARSPDDAHRLWQEAYDASKNREEQTITVPWVTALEWEAKGGSFSVTADISDVLDEHGEGVYSIKVWGKIDGEDVVISEYSIFHGIKSPDAYTPR